MAEQHDPDLVLRLTADIVNTFLGRGDIEPAALPGLILAVRRALSDTPAPLPDGAAPSAPAEVSGAEAPSRPRPAVAIDASITPDYLISLEDGGRYRSLKRHLMARHGLSPEQYRAKWGLPPDYPMVAPNYAATRSEVAKRSGLGKGLQAPADASPRVGRTSTPRK